MIQASMPSMRAESMNDLTGEWEYNNTIWYSSELTLKDNGSFKFHDQGCMGQNFTEGSWTNNNGTILLSSYNSYRPGEEAKTVTQSSNEPRSKKRKLKKGEVEYSFDAFKGVIIQKFPGPNDTLRICFDKVQLNLKGDTLYCVGNNKFITEHKFSRTKNNR